MKKFHGTRRALNKIERTELETWQTRALLARLKRLRFCEESIDRSDMTPEEYQSLNGRIVFKETTLWKDAYADVVDILKAREHVPRRRMTHSSR